MGAGGWQQRAVTAPVLSSERPRVLSWVWIWLALQDWVEDPLLHSLLRLSVTMRRKQKLEVRDLEAMSVLVNSLREAHKTTGPH